MVSSQSKIKPTAESRKISRHKIKLLHKNTIKILEDSITFHGTTIINFKFDNMKTGDYRKKLKIYGRKNQNCFRCKSTISITKISGRTSYYCNKCQR